MSTLPATQLTKPLPLPYNPPQFDGKSLVMHSTSVVSQHKKARIWTVTEDSCFTDEILDRISGCFPSNKTHPAIKERFNTPGEFTQQLSRLVASVQNKKVETFAHLVLGMHGREDSVFLGEKDKTTDLSAKEFSKKLQGIEHIMDPSGKILLFSCNTGLPRACWKFGWGPRYKKNIASCVALASKVEVVAPHDSVSGHRIIWENGSLGFSSKSSVYSISFEKEKISKTLREYSCWPSVISKVYAHENHKTINLWDVIYAAEESLKLFSWKSFKSHICYFINRVQDSESKLFTEQSVLYFVGMMDKVFKTEAFSKRLDAFGADVLKLLVTEHLLRDKTIPPYSLAQAWALNLENGSFFVEARFFTNEWKALDLDDENNRTIMISFWENFDQFFSIEEFHKEACEELHRICESGHLDLIHMAIKFYNEHMYDICSEKELLTPDLLDKIIPILEEDDSYDSMDDLSEYLINSFKKYPHLLLDHLEEETEEGRYESFLEDFIFQDRMDLVEYLAYISEEFLEKDEKLFIRAMRHFYYYTKSENQTYLLNEIFSNNLVKILRAYVSHGKNYKSLEFVLNGFFKSLSNENLKTLYHNLSEKDREFLTVDLVSKGNKVLEIPFEYILRNPLLEPPYLSLEVLYSLV